MYTILSKMTLDADCEKKLITKWITLKCIPKSFVVFPLIQAASHDCRQTKYYNARARARKLSGLLITVSKFLQLINACSLGGQLLLQY